MSSGADFARREREAWRWERMPEDQPQVVFGAALFKGAAHFF
jgi:hypothetical protein